MAHKKIKIKKVVLNKKTIIALYVLVAVLAKIIRYTVMKRVLVEQARGDEIIDIILSGTPLRFHLTDTESSLAFNNSAVIFNAINIFGLTTYSQFEIYISIIWNLITIALILKMPNIEKMETGVFILLTVAVLNIFDFTIAKEPIQFLYFLVIYLIVQNRKCSNKIKTVLSLLILLFCALTFRNYYVLLAVFAPFVNYILGLITRKQLSGKKSIAVALAIIFMVYFGVMLLLKIFSNSLYTQLVFARTRTHSNIAETQIRNLFANSSSNTVIISLEFLATAARLAFPIELIGGSPKYYLFIIYQLIISMFLIRQIARYKNNGFKERIGLCILLGFVLTSAIFEPDFGSWIRHEAVLFPIILLISGEYKTLEKGV